MSQNNNSVLKSGIWYTASNFLVKSIGFITTPLFTRLMTKSEFGDFSTYSSWLSLAIIFVTLNLDSTLISAKYDYKDSFDKYISSILCLSSISVALWLCMVNVFSGFFEEFTDLEIKYLNLMLIYLLFFTALNLFQTRERYNFEYKNSVITGVGVSVATSLLSVLFVYLFSDKFEGRVLGAILPTIILGIIIYIYLLKKGGFPHISCWKYAIPICIPYIPHLLSMTVLNSTDRIMITNICGSEYTALYSLAYNCGAVVTLLLVSLNNAFSPWLGEKIASKEYDKINKVSKRYILCFIFLAIGIMLISPEALLILGGKAYMEAIYVLAPVSMGCACQFLYTLFVNVEQFTKKTGKMALASGIAAGINFVLNIIFIPVFGYLAAAFTTLAGYTALLCMHMLIVKKIGLKEIYDYKFIARVLIAGILAMLIIMVTYSFCIIRYGLCFSYMVLLGVMLIKNKGIIFNFLKKRS